MSAHHLMSGCLLTYTLALLLTPVSATVQILNSINDLKKVDFGDSVPKHSLLLLHWFANTIEMDNNNVIHLTFEPNERDYGAHYYGNHERMLNQLPRGDRYYTIGNLNPDVSSSVRLPQYVTRSPYHLMGNEETNRDRIIVRVRDNINIVLQTNPTIEQVYITQHYGVNRDQGTSYDPAHTYRITNNLLREIRLFSTTTAGNQRRSLGEIRDHFGSNIADCDMMQLNNTWGELACVGLLLFIVITESRCPVKPRKQPREQPKKQRSQQVPSADRGSNASYRSRLPATSRGSADRATVQAYLAVAIDMPEYTPQAMGLEVGTGEKGNATIRWSNVPRIHLDRDVMAVLFKNDRDGSSSKVFKCIAGPSGIYQTSVPLNPGLQVRLHRARRWCCGLWTSVGAELARGPEFDAVAAQQRVQIRGYDAQLQLFVADGKACARLYVGKTFTDWRKLFRKSWVGFYSLPSKAARDYESWRWQWATKFVRCAELDDAAYRAFEYRSGMTIAPGVQARFLPRGVEEVLAHTSPWKKNEMKDIWFH